MTIFLSAQNSLCRGQVVNQVEDWQDWFAIGIQEHELLWRKANGRSDSPAFFADLFLHQTKPERLLHSRSLYSEPTTYTGLNPLAPQAFVFHSSRCGSTLLLQMLSSDARFLCVSEPPLLDVALSALHYQQISATEFKHALQALCLRRQPTQTHAVIKTDSWHLAELPRLRALFPGTPMLYLFRDHAQVLASHQRQCGPQMIAGMLDLNRLGLAEQSQAWDFSGWPDYLLSHSYELAAEYHASYQLRLLNYSELPGALWQQLLPEWRISLNSEQIAALQGATLHHAKSRQVWQGDPSTTHPQVSARLQSAYDKLEQLAAITQA